MFYLSGEEEKLALGHLSYAAKIALQSTCTRLRGGSIVVRDDEVLGVGYNSPPGEKEEQRRCTCKKDSYHKKVTDKTCCVHAEQRAIMDALKNNPEKITGARIYFVRIDEKGAIVPSGNPYCTICSKMSLDIGLAEFVLLHKDGVAVYATDEYNTLSYQYIG